MSIFLGIDGGGTSCKALCCDEHGAVLWEGRGAPTNWTTTPRETFRAHLLECLEGCPTPDAIAGCFAGILSSEDSSEVESLLFSLFPQALVVAEPDYCAAFYSCAPGTDACIIAGTGSVVVARAGDQWQVGGGGGALLGDVGSAFDLVRMGLRKLVYEGAVTDIQSPSPGEGVARYEPGAGTVSSPELGSAHPPHPHSLPLGSGGEGVLNSSPREGEFQRSPQLTQVPLPSLSAALQARFGTLERGPLTRAIYACPSPQAELGMLIGALGEDVAHSDELQWEVAEHFRVLLETACRLTPGTHIGLVGGVWDAHPIFIEVLKSLSKGLDKPGRHVTISKADASPSVGAVRLAMQLQSNEYRRS